MNTDAFPKILIGIIAIVLLLSFSRKANPEEKRRKDLSAIAHKLKLKFNSASDFELAKKISFLSWLKRGEARYAYNIFCGSHSTLPVVLFDYHFSTPADRNSYDYFWSAYIIETKFNFPDLLIYPESRGSRISEALGKSHITFESAEFSRAFSVHASDKKFAYDVCHPKMMEYLLANPDLTLEINQTVVAILFEDWLRPEKIEFNLSRLIEIRKLLPEYLFAKT